MKSKRLEKPKRKRRRKKPKLVQGAFPQKESRGTNCNINKLGAVRIIWHSKYAEFCITMCLATEQGVCVCEGGGGGGVFRGQKGTLEVTAKREN